MRNSKSPSGLGEGRCKNKAEKEAGGGGEEGLEKAQVPPEENALETISSLPKECVRVSYWHIKHMIW